jgi:hypothetical protein
MVSTYAKSQYRFLLGLTHHLLAARPDIKTSELARQLGVSVRAAYNYRAAAMCKELPADPVQAAREFLIQFPDATGREVGAHLGLGRDAGRRYRAAALKDLEKRPPPPAPDPTVPKHTYHIPRFLPKKGK